MLFELFRRQVITPGRSKRRRGAVFEKEQKSLREKARGAEVCLLLKKTRRGEKPPESSSALCGEIVGLGGPRRQGSGVEVCRTESSSAWLGAASRK